jgi:hypothetical protein
MKTKVIAFRVTQDEYDALVYNGKTAGLKLAEFVAWSLRPTIALSKEAVVREQKRLEAKAKRDAKKAANGQ